MAHGVHECVMSVGMNWWCLCRWKSTESPLMKRYTRLKLVITIRSLLCHEDIIGSIIWWQRLDKINWSLRISWSTRHEVWQISNTLD